ncbi:MAG: arsenate reductase ArsC [Planctomycetota bacterium]
MSAERRPRVLFLCVGNSCRSQMAEALTRAAHGDRYAVDSGGTQPKQVDPLALAALREAGVDASGLRSKGVSDLDRRPFDLVVSLCAEAREVDVPTARRLHVPFDDPPRLVAEGREGPEAYGRVRDELRSMIASLPDWLQDHHPDLGAEGALDR